MILMLVIFILIFEVNYVFIVYYIMKIIIYEDNLAKTLVNSSISACNYLYIYIYSISFAPILLCNIICLLDNFIYI